MKHIPLILFLLGCTTLLSAQGYIRAYDFGYQSIFFTSCIAVEDGFIVGGMAQQDGSTPSGLFLTKMDTTGTVVWHQEYRDSLGDDLGLGVGTKIALYPDGGIVMVGQLLNRRHGVMIKTDANGNLEVFHEFEEEGVLTVFYHHVNVLENGELIIAGAKQVSRGDLDAFALRTNLSGDVLWEWRYDELRHTDAVTSLLLQDSMIWVGGSTTQKDSDLPFHALWAKSWIRGLDMSGSIIEEWSSAKEDRIAGAAGLHFTTDRGRVFVGVRSVELPNGNTGAQPLVIKQDSTLAYEWIVEHGNDSVIVNLFKDMDATPDGNWVCGGQMFHQLDDGRFSLPSWIIKIDTTGEKVWERFDTISYNEHYVSDIMVLPSGSIVTVGYVLEGSRNRGFVIKLDPDGCIEPGCRESSSTIDLANDDDVITFYPNPASDRLYVQCHEVHGPYTLQIYSVNGVMCQETELSGGQGAQALSIQSLAPGAYVCRVVQDGKLLSTKKLMISR